MAKPITWVGIDDDKMDLTVAVVRGSRQKEPEVRRIPNEDRALRRWVRRLVRDADGGEIRMCYEAGPNGFALMRRRLTGSLETLAQEDVRAMEVGVLRCFRGIDTAMAVTLVAEIFRVERFTHPRDLMSYFGLTPSVYQSAAKETRGGITKTGNRYARWALGNIAKQYRHKPHVGLGMRRRRKGQPVWAIEIADRAHHRLHNRYWALILRGKPVSKATTAVARELVSFVWEALAETQSRSRQKAA